MDGYSDEPWRPAYKGQLNVCRSKCVSFSFSQIKSVSLLEAKSRTDFLLPITLNILHILYYLQNVTVTDTPTSVISTLQYTMQQVEPVEVFAMIVNTIQLDDNVKLVNPCIIVIHSKISLIHLSVNVSLFSGISFLILKILFFCKAQIFLFTKNINLTKNINFNPLTARIFTVFGHFLVC